MFKPVMNEVDNIKDLAGFLHQNKLFSAASQVYPLRLHS